MNANELADELDGFLKEQEQLPWGTKQVYLDQASTMLRQQQAEIDLLRMTQPNIDYEKELLKPTFVGRELTDKEILEEWDWDSGEILAIDLIDFGHSILRKAQEK